jgi:hypothetical protein
LVSTEKQASRPTLTLFLTPQSEEE